jgi:threonine dehydratase
MQKLKAIPTLVEIRETLIGIQGLIHRTPVMTCQSIDQMAGAQLFFKCENFQKAGAFKMRGAASAALRLTEAEKEKGVVTHSSGNHGQAIARAAQVLGIPAYIIMPENAPEVKKIATAGYGAQITYCAPNIMARETTTAAMEARTGATFVHPFNDYNVIAGQATAAMELLEQVGGDLDAVIAPIGGGGLMSGTALSVHYLAPNTRIYGAEPLAVDDAYRSMQSGSIQENPTTDTIADGLKTNLGEKTFEIIREQLTDIFTVTEEEIVVAMKLVWSRMKIIIEPSCAVPLAAVLRNKEKFAGQRVGIILTGGNVDLDHLPF